MISLTLTTGPSARTRGLNASMWPMLRRIDATVSSGRRYPGPTNAVVTPTWVQDWVQRTEVNSYRADLIERSLTTTPMCIFGSRQGLPLCLGFRGVGAGMSIETLRASQVTSLI